MLSELLFNGLMYGSMAAFAVAVLLQLLSWFRSDTSTASIATCAIASMIIALRAAAVRGDQVPVDPVPDFMRCDGDFVAPCSGIVNPLAAWCGWIRFEGHGTCRIQSCAESSKWVTGTWHVSATSLAIEIPEEARVSHGVNELYVRQGDDNDGSVDISLTREGAPLCRFTFVSEELND